MGSPLRRITDRAVGPDALIGPSGVLGRFVLSRLAPSATGDKLCDCVQIRPGLWPHPDSQLRSDLIPLLPGARALRLVTPRLFATRF